MIKDPVCGMTLEPEKASGQMAHAGNTYYFCSAQCQVIRRECICWLLVRWSSAAPALSAQKPMCPFP